MSRLLTMMVRMATSDNLVALARLEKFPGQPPSTLDPRPSPPPSSQRFFFFFLCKTTEKTRKPLKSPVDGLSPESLRVELGHATRLRAVWSMLLTLHTIVDASSPLVQLPHRN